ncbi:F-box protein [Robbsia andropogonis]|nr:F-box protein [Robbsia andropogonis]MCP1119666.1 F-box protein [Robbsia andropogonis]MCP1129649.1 F-box protein [Robbsia andropogonis]
MEIRGNEAVCHHVASFCGGDAIVESEHIVLPGTYADSFSRLPIDLIVAIVNVLPAHALVSLALTSKRFSSVLLLTFPASFQAVAAVEKVRVGSITGMSFFEALDDIQAVSVNAQKPVLLRKFAVSWAALPRDLLIGMGLSDLHDAFKEKLFFNTLRTEECAITYPPQSMSETLLFVDLIVANYVGVKTFEHCRIWPTELLSITNIDQWPMILDSLLLDVPAQALSREIERFTEKDYAPGTEISDRLATEAVVKLFFVSSFHTFLHTIGKPGRQDVQLRMERQFGRRTEAQWNAIEDRMVLELSARYGHVDLWFLKEECSRWRDGEVFLTRVQNAGIVSKSDS